VEEAEGYWGGFKIVFKRWVLKGIDFFKKKNLRQLPKKFKDYFKKP